MSRPLSTAADVHVDVEATWRALTSPTWPAALDAALGDGSHLVSHADTPGGGAVVVISRRLPEGIPGFLQSFTPQDGRVTQTDTWGPAQDGSRHGTWAVTFPGSPGTISGETSVEPTATGSRWSVRGTVAVKIPLIGGKVEGFLAPLVERLVARQAEVLREQLG